MLLYLRNRNAQITRLPCKIDTDRFEKATEIAANFNLRCLPFIDCVGDTILNHKQILELIKEIAFLRTQNTEIKKEDLDILNDAALKILENQDHYLLINGE